MRDNKLLKIGIIGLVVVSLIHLLLIILKTNFIDSRIIVVGYLIFATTAFVGLIRALAKK